jgi:peptidoglycan/LPS O-acetylase OafA/YrhL
VIQPVQKSETRMRRDLSAYLDLLRLSAALAVFISHVSWRQLSGGFLWQLRFIGHDAVMAFFVLSGFVIQYAVTTKENTLREYEISRLARLYSVVLPALILTFIFDRVGMAHHPASYAFSAETEPLFRIVAGATFLSQSWWNIAVLSDIPFWSLPYEFWYYQIFAAVFFFRGRKRTLLVIFFCFIAGPAILIYLPLWLAGVGAYKAGELAKLNRGAGFAIFASTLTAQGIILIAEARGLIPRHDRPYLPPGFSPIDYLEGFLVAANIFAAMSIRLPLSRVAKPVAAAAGVTFALYLLHLPIFHLLAAFMPQNWSVSTRGLGLIVPTMLLVIALSFVTERRKKEWRTVFRWLLSPTSTRSAKMHVCQLAVVRTTGESAAVIGYSQDSQGRGGSGFRDG